MTYIYHTEPMMSDRHTFDGVKNNILLQDMNIKATKLMSTGAL